MNNNYRVAKIATSQKLPDRFLLIKEISPPENNQECGSLYFLIEITTPWFPATEIGKAIEKTITYNFYQNGKENSEERFEEALKKTNLVLADLAKNGDTSWIGNLNIIVASISKNHIHIANCGQSQAFLLRQQNLQTICEKEKSPNSPINIFSNTITGELETEDKILFTNSELFNHFSEDQIQAILKSFDPISAIHEIAKILKTKKITNVNSLIIEFIPKNKITFQPPAELPDTIYLDRKEDAWLEKAIKKTKPAISETRNRIKNRWQDIKEKISPALRKFTILLGKMILAIGRTIKLIFSGITKSRRQKARERIRTGNIKEWEEFAEIPRHRSSGEIIGGIFSFLGQQIVLLFTKRQKLLIAIILIIILLIGINAIRKSLSQPRVDVAKVIQDATDKENQAKSELALANKNKARELFTQALSILKPAKNNPGDKDKVQGLYSQIQSEIDQMDKIVRLSKTDPVFNFSAYDSNPEVNQIIFSEKELFAANQAINKIYRILETDFSVENTTQIPNQKGQIQATTILSNLVLWKTNSKIIYALNLNNNSLEKQNVNGEWENASRLASYSKNIYLLVPEDNQIYKHTLIGSSWSGAKNSLKSAQDLSGAVDLAIDGNIYILNKDGSCLKFLGGEPIPGFSLRDLPPPADKIAEPTKILTNSELNSIYVLDHSQKRIIEFDKEGNYLDQYLLPDEIGNIKDFALNLTTKKLYVLADDFIYQFGL